MPGPVDSIMLKQPVSNRGSILLGELVAIKLALKHICQYKIERQIHVDIKKIHIFSDSQSAVGQLVLGWECKSHHGTIHEVKNIIKQLEKANIIIEISWTPGHANIKGNEHADRLAKEAAKEAKEKESLPPVISLGDVKEAAKKSGYVKWQEMWEKSDKGRHLFWLRPKVDFKLNHTFESSFGEKVISQLRTGYIELNDYLQKCNIKNNPTCACGEKETISHYLLECTNYETLREKMRRQLFDCCGIIHLDITILLDAKQEEDFKEWRSLILSELESYVSETKRFTKRESNQ